jgi:3-methyladenine DNA glycosylase Mpg
MGIALAENRCDLLSDRLFIEEESGPMRALVWGPRIGITVGTERPWRVHADGNPAVSGVQRRAAGRQRQQADL